MKCSFCENDAAQCVFDPSRKKGEQHYIYCMKCGKEEIVDEHKRT